MTMTLTDALGVWFATIPGGDILMSVQKANIKPHCDVHESYEFDCLDCSEALRITPAVYTGKFDMLFRFRWYDPEDPRNDAWSNKDTKSWYSIPDLSREKAFEAIDALFMAVGKLGKVENKYKILRGENEEFEPFLKRFMKAPFVHAKGYESYEKVVNDWIKGLRKQS